MNLILPNFPNSFMKIQTLETGLSDFHKLTFTALKMHFEKPKPKIFINKDYKVFFNERFRLDVLYVDYSSVTFLHLLEFWTNTLH